jgi:hypothetical protein
MPSHGPAGHAAPTPETCGPNRQHRTGVWRHLAGGVRELLVATIVPLALFAFFQERSGTRMAIVAATTWALGVTLFEIARRGRPSGLVVLSLVTLALKTMSGLATGSSFLFFAVPCAGTATTGAVFAWSGCWQDPLLVRLARDFVPFLGDHLAAAPSRPFVLRLSWAWGIAYGVNAAGTFLLLVLTPLHAFMVLHVLVGWACTATAGMASVLLARRHGPHLLAALRAPGDAGSTRAGAGPHESGELTDRALSTIGTPCRMVPGLPALGPSDIV